MTETGESKKSYDLEARTSKFGMERDSRAYFDIWKNNFNPERVIGLVNVLFEILNH